MTKTLLAILKILSQQPGVIGSREISRNLKFFGVDLTERTVRYHLRILDERGYTQVYGREGHSITEKGKAELDKSGVTDRIGFVIGRIETLSYLTTLNLDTMEGTIILNISYFPDNLYSDVFQSIEPYLNSSYVMSDRILVRRGGETINDNPVPEGRCAIGTVCSVTINGVFLKAGIPVTSRFGGIVEIEGGKPKRFLSLISYEGSSLDPLEIFIRGKMTDVTGAVMTGAGRILASFREIPAVCIDEVKDLTRRMSDRGIGGVLMIGEPNRPLLEIPVGLDKAGILVVGGLNPIAAIEESGIPTESKAMSALFEYSHLHHTQAIMGKKS